MSHFYVANSAGSLSCECVGPSSLCQSVLYADSVEGTYRLVVKPTEVGRHTLNILYNGEHVDGTDTDLCRGICKSEYSGSPFTMHVSTPPNPAKVRVYGPGIESGILNKFRSNFVVETKGAGGGHLTVRVRGPKSEWRTLKLGQRVHRWLPCGHATRPET
jgi:filamin